MEPPKFFAASFSAVVIAQVLCEVYLSRLVPPCRPNLKLRFWSRAVVDVAVSVLVGVVGYAVISALAQSGRKRLAWGLAIVPGAFLVLGALVMQGTNTVLDKSSGVGCYGLLVAALRAPRPAPLK
jgi:hypothetical protein